MALKITKQVVGRSEFPGSHCLNVRIDGRILLRKSVLMELSMTCEASFSEWTSPHRRHRKFAISVPHLQPDVSLPTQGLLSFEEAKISEADPETVSAECRMLFFRRSPPPPPSSGGADDKEEEPKTESWSITQHIRDDYAPMLARLRRLRVLAMTADETAQLDRLVLASLVHFYAVVKPDPADAHLKQKVFSLETDAALGHVCSHCRGVAAEMRRCPCRSGVYYCDRECQRADWPRHRATCGAAAARSSQASAARTAPDS
jgi:hypothetical protein